MPRTT
jgi:uncharacterized protein YndB with AHSA1/START domain